MATSKKVATNEEDIAELDLWLSGYETPDVEISGSATPWRVEPKDKARKYWQLRRWSTKNGKRKRESKYIGSWEQALDLYPTECLTYQPRK